MIDIKNSIFYEDIKEQEAYEKYQERDKIRSYNARKQKAFDTLLGKASGLYPYSGDIALASIMEDESYMVDYQDGCNYYGPNTFLGTPEVIKRKKKPNWIKGTFSSGQVIYITDFGLVFEAKENVPVKKLENWSIPYSDWLLKSLKKKEYLKFVPSYISKMEELLPENIAKQKAIDEEKVRVSYELLYNRAKDLLESIEETVDDVSIELANFIINYDRYWEYSDDHRYCIRYRKRIDIVQRHLTNYPKLSNLWNSKVTKGE